MNLAASSDAGSTALGFVFIILGIGAYWVPSMVAGFRRPSPPNTGSIVVINAFLGWTVAGWVVALAMACRSQPKPAQIVGGMWPPPPGWQVPPDVTQRPPWEAQR